jgi:hypothetical protein
MFACRCFNGFSLSHPNRLVPMAWGAFLAVHWVLRWMLGIFVLVLLLELVLDQGAEGFEDEFE